MAKKKDPIARLSKYLKIKEILSDDEEKEIYKKVELAVKKEIKKFESIPLPKKEDMFRF